MRKSFGFVLGSVLFFAGCAGPGKVPPQGRPSVKTPTLLTKSSGEFISLGGLTGEFTFKDIRVALDPTRDLGPSTDYVLLTGASSQVASLRKNQKIIALPDVAVLLGKQGFTAVKGLRPGMMVQLSKNGGFVFVRAVQGKTVAGAAVNGYLLEFDNGRNLLFSGDNADVDATRQFLFALRDEGKEIHMAFISGLLEESKLLEVIPLLQPQVAVLSGGKTLSKKEIEDLRGKLQEQMFEGSLFLANPSDKFPF